MNRALALVLLLVAFVGYELRQLCREFVEALEAR